MRTCTIVFSVIPLELPPLRERLDDIPELVDHFFAKAKQKHDREQLVMPDLVLRRFGNYNWPGNIRELENIIERLVVLTNLDRKSVSPISPSHLQRAHPSVGHSAPRPSTARHQSRSRGEGTYSARAPKVPLESDTRGELPGYQPEGADLPHREARNSPAGNRRCRGRGP